MYSVFDIAKYLLHLDEQVDGEGLSNLKLQKLVYYCQGFHLALEGKPAFDQTIEAWQYGPVVPDLYHALKENGRSPVQPITGCEPHEIDTKTADVLVDVYNVYGQFSAWRLRDMTHEEKPWIDHEKERSEIPVPELASFFSERVSAT